MSWGMERTNRFIDEKEPRTKNGDTFLCIYVFSVHDATKLRHAKTDPLTGVGSMYKFNFAESLHNIIVMAVKSLRIRPTSSTVCGHQPLWASAVKLFL